MQVYTNQHLRAPKLAQRILGIVGEIILEESVLMALPKPIAE